MQERHRIRVCHITAMIETVGGAQAMLHKLLCNLNRSEFESEVISLKKVGACGRMIQDLGIPVEALGMRGVAQAPRALLHLARRLRQTRPTIVQTWMYHSDLLGGLTAKLAGNLPVLWNIRGSDVPPEVLKRSTLRIAKCCARISSRIPARIIVNSQAGFDVHAALGYDEGRMVVISNGFDLSVLQPSPEHRRSVRLELGVSEDTLLVGLVARFDPQKDHLTFVEAASRLAREVPNVEFLLCGRNVTWHNEELANTIRQMRLEKRFHLLGPRDDMPRIQASLDLAVLSSVCNEGFPNVVGEAMACGVPCVVTDVGDAARIVANTGRIVPLRDPVAMASACLDVLQLPSGERRILGDRARHRIEEHFGLDKITHQYARLWREVAAERCRGNSLPATAPR